MDKRSCCALEFNKRICLFNNDRYVDRTTTSGGSHWSYMMIEITKVAGDLNLIMTNYKFDSSKQMINRKADQFSAQRVQPLLRVRFPRCEIVGFLQSQKSIVFNRSRRKVEINVELFAIDF